MSQGPFFSIITPLYNCKKYIKKSIESVINQTYTSWELILIDDGSTDGSGKICDSFCVDSRIRVIHQDNEGALSSRINGIAIAKGKYALGLDADDYLDQNCLETIKKAIDISGSDLIFFGFRYIGNKRGIVKCTLKSEKEYSQKEILEEVIETTNHSLCDKAIKMEKVKQASCCEIKRKLIVNEDYVHIVDILCNIDTGYVIDDILYNYRVNKNSASNLYNVQHIFDTELATKYVIYKLKIYALWDLNMCNKIYLAYLKMIGFRLLALFFDKKISKEDCKKIHKSKIYASSKKFEIINNLNMSKYEFMLLKMFRYKQYWLLKLLLRF